MRMNLKPSPQIFFCFVVLPELMFFSISGGGVLTENTEYFPASVDKHGSVYNYWEGNECVCFSFMYIRVNMQDIGVELSVDWCFSVSRRLCGAIG